MFRVKSLTLFDTWTKRIEIMYIKKVSIKNIRSIDHFEMEFEEPAGWHVIIGDNGVGKSTVAKAIGLGLIGQNNAFRLRQTIDTWLSFDENIGLIELEITQDKELDFLDNGATYLGDLQSRIVFTRMQNLKLTETTTFENGTKSIDTQNFPSGVGLFEQRGDGKQPYSFGAPPHDKGWFSVGFGPFRRLTGGNIDQETLFKSFPRVGAHLSLFDETVALTEALDWLKELDYERLQEMEQNSLKESTVAFENIVKFINESQLLPHGAQFESLIKGNIIFRDGKNNKINILDLSDGFRSILSLIFELIRNLVRVYGAQAVFTNIEKGQMYIDLPGVVLIDEVDAHLHPSWQTRIGQWFTKYFPNIQFIVTTHSPLICRACEKGSIWRLAAPGSNEESGEINGIARKRLIYGNILDAYGTEAFGDNVSISEDAALMRNRLGELYEKSILGEITKKEEVEFEKLKAILPTFKVNIPNPQ